MTGADLIRQVQGGAIAPVYLFLGEEEFFKEEAWRALMTKLVPAGARRFNGEKLLAKEHTGADVLNRLSTLSMVGSKRLVYVRQIDGWPKDQLKLLETYLVKPLPSACLVLGSSQKKGLDRIQGAVEAVGMVVHFKPLTEGETLRWLQSRAKLAGTVLSGPAASFLLEEVGLNLHLLSNELDKLITYVGARERIELADARQIVSSQRSFSVFELLRYVGQGNPRQAIGSLRQLLLSGESPLGVLALLARQVRILWQVKDAQGRRIPMADLAQKLRLPHPVIRNYVEQSAAFSEGELNHMHRRLQETDVTLKSTRTPPEALLELLIISLCGKQPETLQQ